MSGQPASAPERTVRRKRLLFLATEYWSFLSHKTEMARAAAEAGFEVTVAARGARPSGYEAEPGYTLIDLPWTRGGSTLHALAFLLPDLLRVRRLLARVQPDALQAIDVKPAIVGSLAALGRPITVVNGINGLGYVFFARSPLARIVQAACGWVLRRAVARNAGHILVQNRGDLALLRDRFRIPHARLHLIRGSGVDPGWTPPLPLPETPTFRFLLLSRLLYMKGVQVAVEAHDILRRRGVASELAVCGAPDPGNPSAIPQAVLDRWATIPGVTFMGHLSDVRPVLAACHVVLQPALGGEGLPRALVEASAAGRGAIASDIPGNAEVVVPGETGVLVPPGDAAALADAMERAVRDPAMCARWGRAARARMEAEFAAPLIRAQHADLYRLIASQP
jgi:glycosyltransferase involved in cell wall biosynthesis